MDEALKPRRDYYNAIACLSKNPDITTNVETVRHGLCHSEGQINQSSQLSVQKALYLKSQKRGLKMPKKPIYKKPNLKKTK